MTSRNNDRGGARRWMLATLGILVLCTTFFLPEGTTFVREGNGDTFFFWPDVQATLNLQTGCPSNPLEHWGPCWDDAAADAAASWENVGSPFRFSTQSPTIPTSPCIPDGVNTVAFRSTRCGRDFGDALAVTFLIADPASGAFLDTDVLFDIERQWSTYPGPLQRNRLGAVYDFHRVAIHEFGHVLGLDHPDDFGQSVAAIMNSRVSDIDALQLDDIAGINAIYPPASTELPTGRLENPAADSFASGINIISGWVCTANRVDLQIDGATVQAAYGTARADTQAVCGDENNGFGFLINWNNLGDGPHTVVALANGVEFGRATVTVTTLGQEFLIGASGRYTLPFAGREVTIEWQEGLQNFVIVEVQE